MSIYISKPDEWFDSHTVVYLIDDYRPDINAGLFSGKRNGEEDEEICPFDEFVFISSYDEAAKYLYENNLENNHYVWENVMRSWFHSIGEAY